MHTSLPPPTRTNTPSFTKGGGAMAVRGKQERANGEITQRLGVRGAGSTVFVRLPHLSRLSCCYLNIAVAASLPRFLCGSPQDSHPSFIFTFAASLLTSSLPPSASHCICTSDPRPSFWGFDKFFGVFLFFFETITAVFRRWRSREVKSGKCQKQSLTNRHPVTGLYRFPPLYFPCFFSAYLSPSSPLCCASAL